MIHDWITIFESGNKVVQKCGKCGRMRSSMYDMVYGNTYWVYGDWWSDE